MGTQLNLNTDTVGSITIGLPPIPEQQAIATFLDRETAKIDALVEKQRRMLDLLKEKRTALISHAITKGLNVRKFDIMYSASLLLVVLVQIITVFGTRFTRGLDHKKR